MSDNNESCCGGNSGPGAPPAKKCGCDDCGPTLAFLTLRIWLAVRAILTGIEKYASMRPTGGTVDATSGATLGGTFEKYYSLKAYAAIPESMQKQFAAQPLLPSGITSLFYTVLGPMLILLGLTLLIGLGTRISLFLQGLLYTVLTVGLIMIKQDAGVAWLAIHVIMVAAALMLARHNRFAVCKRW